MSDIYITLHKPFIPLCDLLKISGVADSGAQGKHMVAEGLVKVNGQLELRKTCKIVAQQVVQVGEVTIHVENKT